MMMMKNIKVVLMQGVFQDYDEDHQQQNRQGDGDLQVLPPGKYTWLQLFSLGDCEMDYDKHLPQMNSRVSLWLSEVEDVGGMFSNISQTLGISMKQEEGACTQKT